MKRKAYTFDGFGINGPNEYRDRVATLTDYGRRLGVGPLIERLLNQDIDNVNALELLRRGITCGVFDDAPQFKKDAEKILKAVTI